MNKQRNHNLILLSLGIAAGYVIGAFISALPPLMIETAVSQFGFSQSQASFMIAIERASFILAAAILSILIHKVDLRTIAICGALLVGLGNLATGWTTDIFTFGSMRVLAGVGAGLVGASANAVATSYVNYDRLFARGIIIATISTTILFVTLPSAMVWLPKVGTFATLAIVAFSVIPALLFLKRGNRKSADEQQPVRHLESWLVVALLACFFWSISETAIWEFSSQFGTASGYSANQVGLVLGIGTLLGLAAPMLGNRLSLRFGHLKPLIVVVLVKGIGGFLLSCTVPSLYVVLQVLFSFLCTMSAVYTLAFFAELDPSGRLQALGVAVTMTAGIAGPIANGLMVAPFGLLGVGGLALFNTSLAIVLALQLSKQLAKRNVENGVAVIGETIQSTRD